VIETKALLLPLRLIPIHEVSGVRVQEIGAELRGCGPVGLAVAVRSDDQCRLIRDESDEHVVCVSVSFFQGHEIPLQKIDDVELKL
jgi:hypothetical protein